MLHIYSTESSCATLDNKSNQIYLLRYLRIKHVLVIHDQTYRLGTVIVVVVNKNMWIWKHPLHSYCPLKQSSVLHHGIVFSILNIHHLSLRDCTWAVILMRWKKVFLLVHGLMIWSYFPRCSPFTKTYWNAQIASQ